MKFTVLLEEQLEEMLSMYRKRVNYNISKNIKQWSLQEVTWEVLSKDYDISDFRVLSVDGKIIACMAVVDEDRLYWPSVDKGESLYLHKICVDPDYEGHGYGDVMVSMFIEEGRQLGKKDVRLDVKAYKDALITFYERCGFELDTIIQVHDDFKTRLYRYVYSHEEHPIAYTFSDEIWPLTSLDYTRHTVRALAHKDGIYPFLRIQGDDEFLHRDHLETVGGGIENGESPLFAMHREIYEELGYLCKVERYLTTIQDTYNLLHRTTISMFYKVLLKEDLHQCHLTNLESKLFHSVEWIDEQSLLDSLSYINKEGIDFLIQRRDYTAAKLMVEQDAK